MPIRRISVALSDHWKQDASRRIYWTKWRRTWISLCPYSACTLGEAPCGTTCGSSSVHGSYSGLTMGSDM